MPFRDVAPKKSLGQNFLVDPVHIARIVAAADLSPEDTVLEVGPGRGALTEMLAARAGRVLAVELDDRLVPLLREHFRPYPHVTVIHGDILRLDIGAVVAQAARQADGAGSSVPVADDRGQPASGGLPGQPAAVRYKVVANLPYYIAAAVIRHLLEAAPPPEVLVLTLQREVAERVVATPPRMSLLALSVQYYCSAEIVDRIPAGTFRPVPKVDSAVVRMVRRPERLFPDLDAQAFFAIARAGFSQPRKQIRNTLAAGLGVPPQMAAEWLVRAGIEPQRRAETLSLAEWGRLVRTIRSADGL